MWSRATASGAPTRPGFDGGGKGSNPARRDQHNPTRDPWGRLVILSVRPTVSWLESASGLGLLVSPPRLPRLGAGPAGSGVGLLCDGRIALPPSVHGKDRDCEAD